MSPGLSTEMSRQFHGLWNAAGVHLNSQATEGEIVWLRAHPYPPYYDHLSFRLGNQLFFVRVVDSKGKIESPGNLAGLRKIADACKGYACLLPMRQKLFGGTWVPERSGWGLIDPESKLPIEPRKLVTDEQIEMTDWELQDFAVLTVRKAIEATGCKVLSWHGDPDTAPSLWFEYQGSEPQWVVVMAARHPVKVAERPKHFRDIEERFASVGKIGHYASVAFSSLEGDRLYRGFPLQSDYSGLEQVAGPKIST